MSTSFRTLPRILVAVLPWLTAPLDPAGATVPRTKPRATASAPLRADNSIIPLPLNPIVSSAQRLCSTQTASGIGYTMLRASTGPKPGRSDVVLVNYVGYLAATGTVFDQGMRSALRLDGVIAGFSEGLQLMAKSGVARICIPAASGYGAEESGPIPANSDLVFQVELLDYKTAAEVEGMAKAQAGDAPEQKDAAPRP